MLLVDTWDVASPGGIGPTGQQTEGGRDPGNGQAEDQQHPDRSRPGAESGPVSTATLSEAHATQGPIALARGNSRRDGWRVARPAESHMSSAWPRGRPPSVVVVVAASLVALSCLVLTGAGRAAGSPPSSLSLKACLASGFSARCGTLMVPVNRLTGSGPQIPIRVVVIPAVGAPRRPDPIVWFAGGPGQSAVDDIPDAMPLLLPSNINRDVVFIDQRGTGSSNLTCPAFPGLGDKAALRASVESCLHHLKVDLRFYTTAMFVDDVNEVLSDLGYAKVNLAGGSYGVTAEEVFLQRHPERVRTMTLLSGTLLGIPLFERMPANAQQALDKVFAECERELSCHRAFPDLSADWSALWRSVSKSPWVIPAEDSPTHEPLVVDADMIASAVHDVLLDAKTQVELPLMVHVLATAKDRNAVLGALVKATSSASTTTSSGNQMLDYAILCNEPWAANDPSQLVGKGSFEYHSDFENAEWWQYVCSMIPRAGAAAGSGRLTRSLVPVLSFNGEEDPQDPPSNMAGAKELWPNLLEIDVPDQGHLYNLDLSAACDIPLVETFIERGTTTHLHTSCYSTLPSPSFPLTVQALAKR